MEIESDDQQGINNELKQGLQLIYIYMCCGPKLFMVKFGLSTVEIKVLLFILH